MASRKENTIVASHHVAQERGIPERFLLKVLKPLVSARVLQSVKGPNGGYRLARPANQITLLEIIEAVDGPVRGQVPYIQTEGDGGLHRQLEEVCSLAAERSKKQLQKVKLSDLV
jgi:Rrf2 family protein